MALGLLEPVEPSAGSSVLPATCAASSASRSPTARRARVRRSVPSRRSRTDPNRVAVDASVRTASRTRTGSRFAGAGDDPFGGSRRRTSSASSSEIAGELVRTAHVNAWTVTSTPSLRHHCGPGDLGSSATCSGRSDSVAGRLEAGSAPRKGVSAPGRGAAYATRTFGRVAAGVRAAIPWERAQRTSSSARRLLPIPGSPLRSAIVGRPARRGRARLIAPPKAPPAQ